MNEQALMQRAIELSLRGRGLTYPNPIVGALIANRQGDVLAEGFHQGGAHAEIVALDGLQLSGVKGEDLALFITLEPCNHLGKTPPCSEAILTRGRALGITRVIYAVKDPNPIAEGGAKKIRESGLAIDQMDIPEAHFANRDWLTKMRLGRARIVWKVATSLDGAIAAQDGSSKWITSELARHDVKEERSLVDAIVTGTGTVLADDPSLLGATRNPVRIVMGKREIGSDKRVLSPDAETLLVKSHDLDDFLEVIKDRGFNRVMVESGPTLGSALLRSGLVDELMLYQAPTILGSDRRFTAGIDLSRIDEQIRFRSEAVTEIGGDTKRLLFLDNALNKEFLCSPA